MIILFLFFFQSWAFAAETKVSLPDVTELQPITVQGSATFESLNEDVVLPKKKVSLNGFGANTNPNVTQSLGQEVAFPLIYYGYPSGARGINLGGRTSDDTQVSALGVPINLPQGGGADLSSFPSFLWDGYEISKAPSQGGFSQQAVSGSLELKLWTREQLRRNSPKDFSSQVKASANRQVQDFAVGTKYSQTAVRAGGETGLQEGPAGSLSHILIPDRGHQVIFHILGSDLKSQVPGPASAPSPNAKQKNWRIIPVLESNQVLDQDFIFQTTLFADFSRLQFTDPDHTYYNTDTRTFLYGIENALLLEGYTVGLSARYVRFDANYFPSHTEWPLHASVAKEVQINSDLILASTILADYVDVTGPGFGAKLGLRDHLDGFHDLFSEVRTTPKFPTIAARYYQLGTEYVGNPELKPEQVSALVLGHEFKNPNYFKSSTTLSAEYRQRVQVYSGTTMINSGDAHVFTLSQESGWTIVKPLELQNAATLTSSRLDSSNRAYPDLPKLSDRIQLGYSPFKDTKIKAFAQFVGDADYSSTRNHPGYSLYDLNIYQRVDFIFPDLQLIAGVENIFDRRSEVILDYPLPGRIVHVGLTGQF